MTRGIVVAGPASGVGKTTVALGLMAAFRRRGLSVQPFKCGPDFIDAGHHTRVCGRPSRNLDDWMLSPETNRSIFHRHSAAADIAIVEGVMGLFDGARGTGQGSTAAMAKLLGLPVLLVVDASKMASSAAALVRGFATFDSETRVAGVLFNQVGSVHHYDLLRDALEQTGCAETVGYVPRDESIRMPERHLGLHTAEEGALSDAGLDRLASLIEQYVDLNRIFNIATSPERGVEEPQAPEEPTADSRRPTADSHSIRIAIARDRAFCFYYDDNLDALRAAGAEIAEFSPITGTTIPRGTDAIYLGGGYPELYAAELSANHSMRADIRRFAENGGPIYAECGGLMYLASALRLRNGTTLPMTGILPFVTRLTDRLVRFGYADVCFENDCLLGQRGTRARGHSFHYSTIDDVGSVETAYRVKITLSGKEGPEGFVVRNVLASYIHLHFLSSPAVAASFVHAARCRVSDAISRRPDKQDPERRRRLRGGWGPRETDQ